MRHLLVALGSIVVSLHTSRASYADDASSVGDNTDDAATVEGKKKDERNNDKGKKRKKLEFAGRVFARSAVVKNEGTKAVGQQSLQSARAGADYRSHDLRVQLAVELASKARIKDAFVQLRVLDAAKLDVRAGNFKMPFSAIQLESIWSLPVADRGLIDNVLTKRLQLAGRTVGVMAAADFGAPYHPEVRLGIFQGRNDSGERLESTVDDGFGQTVVARFSIKPAKHIELGAAGSVRSGSLLEVPVKIQRAYAGEVDGTLELPVGPGALRLWVEGMIGTSWIVDPLASYEKTRFLEGRAIAAYRVGGDEKWDRYFEVYGLGGRVDPDRHVADDHVTEVTGGVTYGAAQRWRVQLECEVWRFGTQVPLGIADFLIASRDSTTVLVQLGARLQ